MGKLIAIVVIIILTGMIIFQRVTFTPPLVAVPTQEVVEEVKEEAPPPPKPQFILSYCCHEERSARFNHKDDADNFEQSLCDLGFKTRYHRWQLLPRPVDPNDMFNSPFNRRGPPVYHIIYYHTDGEKYKVFDNLDSARLWEFKLRDLGCATEIAEKYTQSLE